MGRLVVRAGCASMAVALWGCDPGEVTSGMTDDASLIDARRAEDIAAPDIVEVSAPRDVAADAASDTAAPDVRDVPTAPDVLALQDVPAPRDVADLGDDDAEIVEVIFPTTLGCSASTEAAVRVRNRGTTTWTLAGGYALGAVDDSDPLSAGGTRVRLPADVSVAPGAEHRFTIQLRSPGAAATHTSDWRMVREGVRWFGATTVQRVAVDCTAPFTGTFNLADVQIIASPDVRGFPVTSRITDIGFRPGVFRIDHTRRGMWPPVVIADDGTTQEATVWVFFRINGTWYGTGGERLRPNQTEKMLERPSIMATDWFYDRNRWGPLAGYVPSPGELVGFMVVAGSTRVDDRTPVRERTGVVLIRFPADGVAASYPPFAWEE